MKQTNPWILASLVLSSAPVIAHDQDSSTAFREYKTNYVLASLDGGHDDRGQPFSDYDIKFQISFTKPLTLPESASNRVDDTVPGLRDIIGTFNFAYSQKSWWDIGRESKPFYESNYNPALFWTNEFSTDSDLVLTNSYGYEHESNGRNGPFSRSWDRVWYQQNIAIGDRQYFGSAKNDGLVPHYTHEIGVKAWHIIEREGWNEDIDDYLGNVELTYSWTSPNYRANVIARKKSAEVNLFVYSIVRNVMDSGNFAWHLQYFNGYGESLQMYNVKSNTVRLGVAFTY